MSFTSIHFALFLAAVLALYYALSKSYKAQNYLLIAASYLFYSAWDWRFCAMMIWITILDFHCGKFMEMAGGKYRKALVTLSVVSDLTILGIFKYFGFFEGTLIDLLHQLQIPISWPILKVALPIGLSFIVFESMSYTIDVYRRDMEGEFRFSSYALFVSFFPKLVAGPIIRAHTLLSQIEAPRVISRQAIMQGIWLMGFGYFLKLVIANNLGPLVDHAFAHHADISGAQALFAIYGFACQIFADFAGYSSIAIGVAALLGFGLPLNFRQPYLVENPQKFWQHWHISLSTWLRDYLYISLGGNRSGGFKTTRNLMITMVLGGLWHGASWTFVLWGFYHGVLLSLHRLTSGIAAGLRRHPAWRVVAVIGTFQMMCFGWLLFRARSMQEVAHFIRVIVRATPSIDQNDAPLIGATLAAMLAIGLYQGAQRIWGDNVVLAVCSIRTRLVILTALYLATLWFGNFGNAAFIYFQF